jgi:hypothetical protein
MFNDYSQRAIKVMVIARLKAAMRDAPSVDIVDLLSAIIIEDQGDKLVNSLIGIPLNEEYRTSIESVTGEPHEPVFPLDMAALALTKLEEGTTTVRPTSAIGDIRLSPQLGKALNAARTIAINRGRTKVTPLTLLDAAFPEANVSQVKVFLDAGITREKLNELMEKEERRF